MDAATRAQAYSPSSVLDGPIDPFIQAYVDKSAAAYAAFDNVQTIKYGPKSSNSIDLLMPFGSKLAPLHIFIHGGYWQLLSKRDSFFPAPDTLKRGMGFAAIDYTLAPDASLDDIVSECCDAIECLHDNAARFGYDPSAFILSGSSAGAHLAAMCCLKLPANRRPKGLALLSGIYELEPLIGTYINDAVGMDIDVAKRNSPMLAASDLCQAISNTLWHSYRGTCVIQDTIVYIILEYTDMELLNWIFVYLKQNDSMFGETILYYDVIGGECH